MGSNDSLAGSDAATEEELRVEAREGRSEGSRRSKPTRGAPPSSLSQPVLSDRSRSSSPIKHSNLPVVKHPLPSKSKATPTPSIPRSSNRRSTDSNSTPRNNPSVLRGGRSALASRVGGLRQHLFLPRTQADKSPASLSFLPQSSSPETRYTPGSYRAFEFKTPAPISPTTDINAKGEILPPSSISQKLGATPTPTLEPSLPVNDTSDMSSTIESTSTQTFRPETDRGYEGSPMARLIAQYKASSDDDVSTYQRAVNLSSKKSLLRNEIVENRGSQKSYALHASLLGEVSQVVNELQVFLERTSTLIPE